MSNTTSSNSGPGLKRVLGLSSLVLYGIILIQPTAPMPLFGAAVNLAHGHVVTTILIGMVGMMFTAISYGRMANAYPSAVSAGASLAVLTYIGFDGISTLSEEVRNPRRNILLASVLVCVITGVLASIQVYTAQLVWPGTSFPDQDTAFCYVAGKAGGLWLFHAVNFALLVATIGSGSGAQLGAGRLLYGMGRDNAIPKKFFGAINPRTRVPSNNIILVGVLTLGGAFFLSYPLGAQLLNFGALIAFMGVNASSFVCCFLRKERKTFGHLIVPVLGFSICLYLWISLGIKAKLVGLSWLTIGVLYGAYRTSWYRKPMQFFKIENSSDE
jgi:putrescine importer